MGVLRDYNFSGISEDAYRTAIGGYGYIILEQWGDLDAGEAARFGMKHLFKLTEGSRQEVLFFFRGENDHFADEGDVLDRTFCALRVWAVTKPDEMKAWIATLKEEDLRVALTWLLENPWGTVSEE